VLISGRYACRVLSAFNYMRGVEEGKKRCSPEWKMATSKGKDECGRRNVVELYMYKISKLMLKRTVLQALEV
jgi:hypothetical protein